MYWCIYIQYVSLWLVPVYCAADETRVMSNTTLKKKAVQEIISIHLILMDLSWKHILKVCNFGTLAPIFHTWFCLFSDFYKIFPLWENRLSEATCFLGVHFWKRWNYGETWPLFSFKVSERESSITCSWTANTKLTEQYVDCYITSIRLNTQLNAPDPTAQGSESHQCYVCDSMSRA